MKKIGIFPGSFDPFHEGHSNLLESSLRQLNLDSVYLIPLINKRKNQTPLSDRCEALKEKFKDRKDIEIVEYPHEDYLKKIAEIQLEVLSNRGSVFRLMGETCYNAYPEIGIPPLRDEDDTLTEILKSASIAVLPNPNDGHEILYPELPDKYIKNIHRLIADTRENLITSIAQKIKSDTKIGLREQKYNEYYKAQGKDAQDYDTWEQKVFSGDVLRLGFSHGTFNTVHDGHLELWNQALKQLNLDGVFVWPSNNPIHKPDVKNVTDRKKQIEEILKKNERIHLLDYPEHLIARMKNEDVEDIILQHNAILKWFLNVLQCRIDCYRVFGSDSVKTYLEAEHVKLLSLLKETGSIVSLERMGVKIPNHTPNIICLQVNDRHSYWLSSSKEKQIRDDFENTLLLDVEMKHAPQGSFSEATMELERFSKKVGYTFSRLGEHKNMDKADDLEYIEKIASSGEERPAKFVITKDGKIWADNSHWTLAYLLRHGDKAKIRDIPHYFVDLREDHPVIVGKPQHIGRESLETMVSYAKEIQERLDHGWRPKELSFTLKNFLIESNYFRFN